MDFDGFKDASELKQARIKLIKDPYSYSVFTSPSGNGLKVLVKIPEDIPNHTQYFLSLQDYYKMKEFDSTCKNISRVCYESYDPKLHVNKDSSVYDSLVVETPEPLEYKNSAPTFVITDPNKVVTRLKKWWETKYGMVEGQRNNNLYILASAFNDFGVHKDEAYSIMLDYVGGSFSARELNTTVNSAYTHTENFNTRFFEDSDTRDAVKKQLKTGVPKRRSALS